MENLEQFINRIIEEKGFQNEAPEVLTQIKEDLLESVERRINAMIIKNLDEHILPDFEALLDADNKEKIQVFIKQHIPDIDERVAAELLEFKTLYLG